MRQGSKLAAILLLLVFCGAVQAHDGEEGRQDAPIILTDLSEQEIEHFDAPDWKGTFTLFVQNSSDTAWTDFHFEIFTIPGQGDASSVFFDDDVLFMTGYPAVHTIENATGFGSNKLNLFFDGNPVQPGEIVSFTVYTDNTAGKVNFGIAFYPTVPEPATLALLAMGGLFAIRRKK